MRTWNIIDGDDGTYVLLNGSDTVIRKHKNISFTVMIGLLSKMEELDVPIAYTDGIKEIYLTYLKGKLEGDLKRKERKIRIGCNNAFLNTLHETLIHELGHHVDDREDISDRNDFVREWKKLSGSFAQYDMQSQPDEYFAHAFTEYYVNRRGMAQRYPLMYRYSKQIHDKYSKK